MKLDRSLLLLALSGVALRLWLIWAGWCDKYVIADDAYYYFTIARNIAHGMGPTFDGLAPTNGYHPLYLIALIPLFWLAGLVHAGPWIPVHGALTICAACDAISGFVLYRMMSAMGFRGGAIWAAAIWYLSPFTVLLSMRGLEGSVSVLLVSLWLAQLLELYKRDWSGPRAAWLGALMGGAVLARTDNGFIFGAALLAAAVTAWAAKTVTLKRLVRALLVSASVAFALIVPWIGWNIATFGSPIQVSAAAKLANNNLYGHFGNASGLVAFIAGGMRLLAFLWQPSVYVAGEEFKSPHYTYVAIWITAFLAVLALPAVVRELRRPRSSGSTVLLVAAATILVVHSGLYAFVLKSYSTWYASAPSYVLAMVGGLGIGELLETAGVAQRRAAIGVASSFGIGLFALFFWQTGISPQAPSKHLAPLFRAIAARAPQAHSIGVFNAGRPGYFAPGFGEFRVVDLDCLVNNAAFTAWKRGEYYVYVLKNVDLLLMDDPHAFDSWLAASEKDRLLQQYPRWGATGIYGPVTPP